MQQVTAESFTNYLLALSDSALFRNKMFVGSAGKGDAASRVIGMMEMWKITTFF